MPNYRRAFISGGTWFFTVNLLQRHGHDLWVREIDLLRATVRRVRKSYPFHIDAWVVLPEHMHSVWSLPPSDSDFSTRWRLITSGFSRTLPQTERRSEVRRAAGERGIWQRHYWEHAIRDDADYVHMNPLKHGRVRRVSEWPYSTFHGYVRKGSYPLDWCGDVNISVEGDDSRGWQTIHRQSAPQNFPMSGGGREQPERFVKLLEVDVALFFAPTSLSEKRNVS